MAQKSKSTIPGSILEIIKKLDNIKNMLLKSYKDMDIELVDKLINKFEKDLKQSKKIDKEIYGFFSNKCNFRNKKDLIEFAEKNFNYKIDSSTLRRDIEKELAVIANERNYSLKILNELIGKVKIGKKTTSRKRKSSKKSSKSYKKTSSSNKKTIKKTIVKDSLKNKYNDQTLRWSNLSIEDLKKELEDTNKYPTVSSLKQSAYSILSSSEKRIRNRKKLIDTIINYYKNLNSLANFGS
ncbi:MAG: hypothetical protein ACTSRZ_02040 [Promethearchaeota archaeon]